MSEKKKKLDDILPDVNPPSEKKKTVFDGVLPEIDPRDAMMADVWMERAKTEVMANRLKQVTIRSALEELEGGQKTFMTGLSVEETAEIMQVLPREKLDDFMLLGVLIDRVKKLEPREARRELVALLKVWPKPNQARDSKIFNAGMGVGTDGLAAVADAARTGSKEEMVKALLQSAEKARRTFESLQLG